MYPAALHTAARNLLSATGAHQVILYGSRAHGDAAEDSDWNLAVILPDDLAPDQWTPSTLQPLVTGLGHSFHVVAMQKSVYDEARLNPGTVSNDVWKDGFVLAESPAK